MFSDGSTIYSYGRHFPIARKLGTTYNNCEVVLFNSNGDSVSTAKHKTIEYRALNRDTCKIFTVPNVQPANCEWTRDLSPELHAENVQAYCADILDYIEKAERARKHGHYHARRAQDMLIELNEYVDAFGLGSPDIDVHSLQQRAEQMLSVAQRARRLDDERRAARSEELAQQWAEGASTECPHTPVPYVRVNGNLIETSWGAKIPLRTGLLLLDMATRCRDGQKAFTPDKKHPVGAFYLDRIDADGTLHVGCHHLPYDRLYSAAMIAGAELVPSGFWRIPESA